MFTSREMLRLVSMLFMLSVVAITFYRARLLSQAPAPPLPPPDEESSVDLKAAQTPETPPAEGVRSPDADPAEQKAFQEAAQLITDRALSVHPTEMPAYWRLVRWVRQQPVDALKPRAGEISFRTLYHHPAANRGKLIRLDLDVRSVVPKDAPEPNPAGAKKLYELIGWPPDGSGWLYWIITPELPPGFPIGERVDARATVYGYFFKLQGYHTSEAKPNARPLIAPLIIGRVVMQPGVVATSPAVEERYVVIAVAGVIILAIAGAWLVGRRRRPQAATSSFGETPAADSYASPNGENAESTPSDDDFDWLKNA